MILMTTMMQRHDAAGIREVITAVDMVIQRRSVPAASRATYVPPKKKKIEGLQAPLWFLTDSLFASNLNIDHS